MTGDRIRKAGGRVLSPEMREVVLMKIYCMSDIHGCIAELEYALSLVEEQLSKPDTRLVLLGDYVHGPDSYAVLDKIISLQNKCVSGADGEAHYYIDGTVDVSGRLPVLMVDTEKDLYYRVTESGNWLILPYGEENS